MGVEGKANSLSYPESYLLLVWFIMAKLSYPGFSPNSSDSTTKIRRGWPRDSGKPLNPPWP